MNLIERYVQEVGRALPRAQRGDIEQELRSLLRDSLEGRVKEQGDDEETSQIELLRELGPPDEMAQSYSPRARWLVGPRYFGGFTRALWICTVVGLIALAQAAFGVAFWTGGWRTVLLSAGHVGFHVFQSWLTMVGFVTLVFAVLERALAERVSERGDWDPRGLPPAAGPGYASRTASVVRGALALGGLALVNFFPGTLGGAFVIIEGQTRFAPLLGSGMDAARLPLSAVLIIEFVLAVVLLRRTSWSLPTRVADIAAKLLWVGVLVKLALGESLHASASSLVSLDWPEQAAVLYASHAEKVLHGRLELILIGAASIMAVVAAVRVVRHVKGVRAEG